MTLIISYSIVNIQVFRSGKIRSHLIENISVMSTLTLAQDLKVELAQDIIIPNICVK